VTRLLALLRAHRIVVKVTTTHRYHLSVPGRRIVAALLAAHASNVSRLTETAYNPHHSRGIHGISMQRKQGISTPSLACPAGLSIDCAATSRRKSQSTMKKSRGLRA
jgi:hypothetical protein